MMQIKQKALPRVAFQDFKPLTIIADIEYLALHPNILLNLFIDKIDIIHNLASRDCFHYFYESNCFLEDPEKVI